MLTNNRSAKQTLNQFSNDLLKKTQTIQDKLPQVLATLDQQDPTIQMRLKSLTDAFEQLHLESSHFKQDLITNQFSKQKTELLEKYDKKNAQWHSKIEKLQTQLEKYCEHLIQLTTTLDPDSLKTYCLEPIVQLTKQFNQVLSLLDNTEQQITNHSIRPAN